MRQLGGLSVEAAAGAAASIKGWSSVVATAPALLATFATGIRCAFLLLPDAARFLLATFSSRLGCASTILGEVTFTAFLLVHGRVLQMVG